MAQITLFSVVEALTDARKFLRTALAPSSCIGRRVARGAIERAHRLDTTWIGVYTPIFDVSMGRLQHLRGSRCRLRTGLIPFVGQRQFGLRCLDDPPRALCRV